MSIRTTVTLDEDVAAKLKEQSLARGLPFRKLLNEAIRKGLDSMLAGMPRKKFKVEPVDMGHISGTNYDNIAELIEVAEGERWR